MHALTRATKSGIGKAISTQLIRDGWLVTLCDIQDTAGQVLATILSPNATFCPCNVLSYASQASIFTHVHQKHGRIDALLANAGHSDRGSIYMLNWRDKDEIPPELGLLSTDVCYKGFLYGVQLTIHFMRKNKGSGGVGGCVVATSSIASVHSHQTLPGYCGAKAAINQFKENISINAILPGIVITGAVPQASIDTTTPERITPVRTVEDAYKLCLDDTSMTGQLVECSVDKHFFLPAPEMANGAAAKRACTLCEPFFE
ncbi:15-hydroxyprostaglandin dehydrogenase [Lentithecium fluviatile CBS 122367]|uniref:15-hydroxyprostaglandin dehydrogenase n=1 Tax=Lentithecium fluviatile CBS 122367 TaxID=1168545 RepID=A0A6G1IFH3_9PLEO|nr:15-hydroxyprostaglandin dehydrogenase [Lentithecium fluviatile CBS 122367]